MASKEYFQQRYLGDKERILARQREYYRANKAKIISRKLDYQRDQYENNINFRLTKLLRGRIRSAIQNNQKVGSAVSDLGMTVQHLRWYLEGMFEAGMTWENYGEWELDHIRPLSSFDLTDREQFLVACNWMNLQPLWKAENRSKGAK